MLLTPSLSINLIKITRPIHHTYYAADKKQKCHPTTFRIVFQRIVSLTILHPATARKKVDDRPPLYIGVRVYTRLSPYRVWIYTRGAREKAGVSGGDIIEYSKISFLSGPTRACYSRVREGGRVRLSYIGALFATAR